MARKSKHTGGNLPMTHYERTKKFASSEYGTTRQRLAGHSQYQLGHCALSLTSLYTTSNNASINSSSSSSTAATAASSSTNKKIVKTTALCTPSGYLYSESAILEYLLTKTQELKQQQAAYEKLQHDALQHEQETKLQAEQDSKVAHFQQAQQQQLLIASSDSNNNFTKKRKLEDSEQQKAQTELKHSSYWLAQSQPELQSRSLEDQAKMTKPPPERPLSPHTQQPIRRKDLWTVELQWEVPAAAAPSSGDNSERAATSSLLQPQLFCSVSEKALKSQAVTAYWTDKKLPGTLVLTSVYDQLIAPEKRCPVTCRKIKYTRQLQKSGSSFAASGQNVQVSQYRPTIT